MVIGFTQLVEKSQQAHGLLSTGMLFSVRKL